MSNLNVRKRRGASKKQMPGKCGKPPPPPPRLPPPQQIKNNAKPPSVPTSNQTNWPKPRGLKKSAWIQFLKWLPTPLPPNPPQSRKRLATPPIVPPSQSQSPQLPEVASQPTGKSQWINLLCSRGTGQI